MSTEFTEDTPLDEVTPSADAVPTDGAPAEEAPAPDAPVVTADAESAPTEPPAEEAPVDYAKMAEEDLAEIKRLDPAYAPAAHLGELPFAARFAELRDLGLSVKEALAAAAPRFPRTDGRAHLRAVAPRGGKAAPEGLAPSELKNARALFYGLSDSEINALYRRVTQKHND